MAYPASPSQEVTLIGLCDGELHPNRYRSSFLTNKVGGRPDWSPVVSPQSPRCGLCGAPLVHVVQVYCPLQDSPYHRNLHLFACAGATCSGGGAWRVLRSQCLEAEVAAAAAQRNPGRTVAAQEAPMSVTDWCDSADDWGTEEGEDECGGGVRKESQVQEEAAEAACEIDVSSQFKDLSLGASQEDVPVLRPFFISVEEESDLCGGDEDDLQHVEELLREYERREGGVGELEGGGGGEEKYEKTRARHGDAVFSRFMKKISRCPQQILRYCRGGKPLFISEPPSNMAQLVSACAACGGSRMFELQLMPALVSLLQRTDGGGGRVELEFGTMLVYTCTDSCWTEGSGAVEEFCFAQPDPDQQLFR